MPATQTIRTVKKTKNSGKAKATKVKTVFKQAVKNTKKSVPKKSTAKKKR